MGIQKHRRSRKSGATRRGAHWKARPVTLVECPKCHSPMRPHRVCENCGYYAGREVIKVEDEETKK